MGTLSRARLLRARIRRSRRGVSPIIATILLVAITVALAASLYILLIPFISHVSTPIQDNLSWGPSTPVTGAPGNPACAVGHYCWRVSIASATGGVSALSLLLYVQGASQLTISNSTWTFTFLTSTNTVAASAPGPEAGSSAPGWTGNGTSTGLNLAWYLWIDTGWANSFAGQSVVLQTVGTNGFSNGFPVTLST